MSICVFCYVEREVEMVNINGRCDNCGGTYFEDKEDLDEELNADPRS